MTIHIEDLTLEVIIGILDFERTSPQQVVVETKINYIYTENNFINYVHVVERIQEELKTKRFFLLEEALEQIGTLLLEHYPAIESLFLKISKPNILPNAHVALSKSWFNSPQHQKIEFHEKNI